MQHTTNYNLPQWEDTDAVKREDVNGAMSAVDAALTGLDAAIAANASPLVKLLDYTTTEEAASFSVDVSALALGDYPLLFMLLDSPKTSSIDVFSVTVNHLTESGSYYHQSDGRMSAATKLTEAVRCGLFVLRARDGNYLHCMTYSFFYQDTISITTPHNYYSGTADTVETFDFNSTTSGSHAFSPGTRVTIWALRR